MASEDWSNQDLLDRARRVGQRLVDRLDLEVPVPIDEVVRVFATVEEDSIPADCDALVVGLTSLDRARPLVIVNRLRPPRRKRFSLAHELGHILIPGHLGIEVCNMEASYYSSSTEEREAHAFASEVLLPTRWLVPLIEEADSPTEVFIEVNKADVSAAAVCLAVHRLLPPGYVLALMDNSNVELSLLSPGTEANRPQQGRGLDERAISQFSTDQGEATLSDRTLRWWRFESETHLPTVLDQRTASEILREIADEIYEDDPAGRKHALASINGIAGFAKGGFPDAETPEKMLARLRARFVDRGKHAFVMEHPRFDDYLARKAEELAG